MFLLIHTHHNYSRKSGLPKDGPMMMMMKMISSILHMWSRRRLEDAGHERGRSQPHVRLA